MSIKLIADENIPLKVVHRLRDEGINVISITESSRGIPDIKVIDIAQHEKGYILSFDKDFGELVFKQKLSVDGVILLRIEPRSIDYIFEKIKRALIIIESDSKSNFIVVDNEKVRIRKIKI